MGVNEGGVAAGGAEVAGDIGVAAGRHGDGGGVLDVGVRGEGGRPDQRIGGGGEATEAALGRSDVAQRKALRRFIEGEGHAAGFTGLEGGGGDVDGHRGGGGVVGKGQCRAGRRDVAGRVGLTHIDGVAALGRGEAAAPVGAVGAVFHQGAGLGTADGEGAIVGDLVAAGNAAVGAQGQGRRSRGAGVKKNCGGIAVPTQRTLLFQPARSKA